MELSHWSAQSVRTLFVSSTKACASRSLCIARGPIIRSPLMQVVSLGLWQEEGQARSDNQEDVYEGRGDIE